MFYTKEWSHSSRNYTGVPKLEGGKVVFDLFGPKSFIFSRCNVFLCPFLQEPWILWNHKSILIVRKVNHPRTKLQYVNTIGHWLKWYLRETLNLVVVVSDANSMRVYFICLAFCDCVSSKTDLHFKHFRTYELNKSL